MIEICLTHGGSLPGQLCNPGCEFSTIVTDADLFQALCTLAYHKPAIKPQIRMFGLHPQNTVIRAGGFLWNVDVPEDRVSFVEWVDRVRVDPTAEPSNLDEDDE